jgi:hypothetical protein
MENLTYYPVNGQLCWSPNWFLARKRIHKAMGRTHPFIAKLGANKVAKFKPKFKKV